MKLTNYFYQSSRHLSDACLRTFRDGNPVDVEVFRFINGLHFDYRSVLAIECVDTLAESSKNHLGGELVHHQSYEVELQAGAALSNVIAGVWLPDEVKRGGSFELHVCACRYVPLIGMNCTKEEYEKRGVVYSELLFIHLIFCRTKKSSFKPATNPFIYESYDQLGFIGIDEGLFNQFIIERMGRGKHDLLASFTSTEIASELFHAGLMILCWGITPWVYAISSIEKGGTGLSFPQGLRVCQSGSYVFLEEIEEISVIPGTALREWNTDAKAAWPKLRLNGTGRTVQVDLCVAAAISPHTPPLPDYLPMPFFNLGRVDSALEESTPILSADIESCIS